MCGFDVVRMGNVWMFPPPLATEIYITGFRLQFFTFWSRAKPCRNGFLMSSCRMIFQLPGCLCRSETRNLNAAYAAILLHSVPPETPLVRYAAPHRRHLAA
jgi:hypothetical protein